MSAKPLNPRNLLFIDALYADPERIAARAYSLVYGIEGKPASVAASRLLRDERVKAEMARRDAEIAAAAPISPEEVRREITDLAKADPRDLFEYRRGACRYCYGDGFMYQRTPQEYRDAFAEYQALRGQTDPAGLHFDHKGGVGFNPNREPHPGCPECFGHGEGYTYIKDSRTVPKAAARLIAGIEETKYGVKVRTRSQDGAVELAARMHGLLAPKGDDQDGDVPPAATVTYAARDASKPA